MLSRVADALFWMSRYLERAEQVARLLDVSFHVELDLHGILGGPHELQWSAVLFTLQHPPITPAEGETLPASITRRLTFDLENPISIMTCVNRARNNARSVRGSISSDMWRELNKLYWQLSDPAFRRDVANSPHDLFQTVQTGSQLFQGLCDATLAHDEGWQFIQLGKYLERAEKTLRLLDVKHRALSELPDNSAGLALANLQWSAVLQSCLAYESYQRLYISRVEPEGVIEFLLTNPEFPHSVRFCLEHAAASLAEISGQPLDRCDSPSARLLGRIVNNLQFRDIDDLLESGLHAFLEQSLQRCSQAGTAIQRQYALH
jgi:uncharacterized alpha-E superfamily protein